MKNQTRIFKIVLCMVTLVLIAITADAQILPPPPPGGSGGTNVPLDPASWALLAGAGAYAVKKYRKGKEQDDDANI
ncbi:hypothetical protein BH09BAC1_BH09BAC1_29370 [soil metagenome]